jgi:hypothetical protein
LADFREREEEDFSNSSYGVPKIKSKAGGNGDGIYNPFLFLFRGKFFIKQQRADFFLSTDSKDGNSRLCILQVLLLYWDVSIASFP